MFLVLICAHDPLDCLSLLKTILVKRFLLQLKFVVSLITELTKFYLFVVAGPFNSLSATHFLLHHSLLNFLPVFFLLEIFNLFLLLLSHLFLFKLSLPFFNFSLPI
jgi:hypothetical protein